MLRQPCLQTLSVVAAIASAARADPQVSVALTAGGGAGELRAAETGGLFHLGLHGDVMMFRARDGQFDAGPYVEVLTRTFETFEAGGGASLLIPVTEAVPLIVSGGPFVRGARAGWDGGVAGEMFFGSRSFNFHSAYGFAVGAFFQTRVGLGPAKQLDMLGGLQIDLELVALPFILVWQAFR